MAIFKIVSLQNRSFLAATLSSNKLMTQNRCFSADSLPISASEILFYILVFFPHLCLYFSCGKVELSLFKLKA